MIKLAMGKIFNGREYQKKLLAQLQRQFRQLPAGQQQRRLVSVLVGNNPASQLYIRMKQQFAQKIGINFQVHQFAAAAPPAEVIRQVQKLGQETNVAGLMVQLPLPANWSPAQERQLLDTIPPHKDIDCLTSQNLGLLLAGQPHFLPATVAAVVAILQEAGFPAAKLRGQVITVIGKSLIVGTPLVNWLLRAGATVVSCDQATQDLGQWTRASKIVISAAGRPQLITGAMISRGVVAIDIASPRGDFDFASVAPKAEFITPVPGGVGPLTVAFLMANFSQAITRH